MSRIIKVVFVLLASLAGIVAVAAVAFLLFFDPNDYKDEISAGVKDATGRDLAIDGDLSVSIFPWLAIEMGHTTLGNAEGFGDEPFLEFDEARLSVKILPLIVSQTAEIGTAALDGLSVNLEVAANGRTNWDDLSEVGESEPVETPDGDTGPAEFNVSGISVSNAKLRYADAQSGSTYALSDLRFETGGIANDEPINLDAEFDFSAEPDNLGGHLSIRTTITMSDNGATVLVDGLNINGELSGITSAPTEFNFDSREIRIDTAGQNADVGELDLMVLGLAISADVEPFSYSGSPQPSAKLRVAEFSLKELLQTLDIEAPATADPDAMSRVSFEASAKTGEQSIALSELLLQLDDSNMTGSLSLPTTASGALGFDLTVDAINIDAYMAPADESAAASDEESGDFELPVDMIRTLHANGSFRIERASLSGLEFTNMEVGLASADGRLRLNPLSADLYDGTYKGDVRIDASGDTPSISVDEHITGVSLAALTTSMYDVDNITGHVNGSFVLGGTGQTVSAIQRDLDGTMSFELVDGALEGTDIWHQLRVARARFRAEQPPEPSLPARTEFTTVQASGTVTDGIFENDDLLAELPFLQLTGAGIVDLGAAQVNYTMQARLLEKPELTRELSAGELEDFTEVVIPLRVTGALSEPSIQPDIEALVRQQVEEEIEERTEELKDRLFDRLLGGDDDENADADADAEEEEEDPADALKRKLLEDLIGN